jgi:hypothetical protein
MWKPYSINTPTLIKERKGKEIKSLGFPASQTRKPKLQTN